jgi:large subunit ribosomal protein L4
MAISKKIKDGKFKIISELKMSKPKTSTFREKMSSLKLDSALFIEKDKIDSNFFMASKNVPKIDILPLAGINVYDILKRDFLVFSENAIGGISERFEK